MIKLIDRTVLKDNIKFIAKIVIPLVGIAVFIVMATLLYIRTVPDKTLEWYVQREIEYEIEQYYEEHPIELIELREIKDVRDYAHDEGAYSVCYETSVYWVDDTGDRDKVHCDKYTTFVYYRKINGDLGQRAHYDILDCDSCPLVN